MTVYRGYEIELTELTAAVKTGGREEVRPVYIIPGLKERPGSPFLTSPEEARDYIDAELDAREEWKAARTWQWEGTLRRRGNSIAVSVPAKAVRILSLEEGDEVLLTLEKKRRARRHRKWARRGRPSRVREGVPG